MTYTAPVIHKSTPYPMANGAYGFPRGQKRRIQPFALMCLHISGNKNTASMGDKEGLRAESLWHQRKRSASDPGNSAHNYIGRDGTINQFYPTAYAGWNNGRLNKPNTRLKTIRRIIELNQRGINPNEAFVREVECTGYPGSYPLTKAQRESAAYLIALDSIKHDLPIDRNTVILHADIDGVNRLNCPFGANVRDEQVDRLISRARVIKQTLLGNDPVPEPEPDPEPKPEPEPTKAQLKEMLAVAEGIIESQEKDLDRLVALAATMHEVLAPYVVEEDEPVT